MRVALVQHAFHMNTAGIVTGLVARGHEVLPIANVGLGTASAAEATGTEAERVPYSARSIRRFGAKGSYRYGTPKTLLLARTLLAFRPDVVIARDLRRTSLITFVITKAIGATPILWLLRPELKPRLMSRTLRRLARPLLPRRRFHSGYAGVFDEDLVIGDGPEESRFLGLPLPWDEDQMPEHAARRDDGHRVRLLVVSMFGNPKKRLDWVLRAIHATGLGDQVDVTFVGARSDEARKGPIATLTRLQTEFGLRPASFRLDVPHDEVRQLMREHHVLVHPAQWEPYGAVIPEAMSQGLAVLCGDRCGAAALLEDDVSGVLFTTASLGHFTAQLERLVRDEATRYRIAQAALDEARAHLLPTVWAERFERLMLSA